MRINNKVTAFLGLGGNLGEPFETFKRSRKQLLSHPQISLIRSSPVYQTPPLGGPAGQPDYLNAVLMLKTDLEPQTLLAQCQKVEEGEGRVRTERWGARTLDLDLLFFGDQIIREEGLQVPHPRLEERHFVLLPLVALAPELLHPTSGLNMQELLNKLPPAKNIRVLYRDW